MSFLPMNSPTWSNLQLLDFPYQQAWLVPPAFSRDSSSSCFFKSFFRSLSWHEPKNRRTWMFEVEIKEKQQQMQLWFWKWCSLSLKCKVMTYSSCPEFHQCVAVLLFQKQLKPSCFQTLPSTILIWFENTQLTSTSGVWVSCQFFHMILQPMKPSKNLGFNLRNGTLTLNDIFIPQKCSTSPLRWSM